MTFFKVLSFIILILLSVLLVNSDTNLGTADAWDFSTPDLVCKFRATQNDGIETTMEAFSAVSNNQSLTASNEAHLLKWITAGYPTILKRHIIDDLNFNYIIHTSPQGFYMAVDMLTSNQISLLMKAVELKYNINVKPSQFIVLPPSSFTCVLHLFNDNGLQSTLNGAVRNVSSSSHPSILIIDFLFDKTSAKHQQLLNPLNNKINMSMNCKYKSPLETKKKELLTPIKVLKNSDKTDLIKRIFHESKQKITKLVTLTQLKGISAKIFTLLNISDIHANYFESLFVSNMINKVAVRDTTSWVQLLDNELDKFSMFGVASLGKLEVKNIKLAIQGIFSVTNSPLQMITANRTLYNNFLKENNTKVYNTLFNITDSFDFINKKSETWMSKRIDKEQQLKELNSEYPQSDIKWRFEDGDVSNITIEAIQVFELSHDNFKNGFTLEIIKGFQFLFWETDWRVNLFQDIIKPLRQLETITNETIKEMKLKLEEQYRELINRTAKPRPKCSKAVNQWNITESKNTKDQLHLLFNQRKTLLFTGSVSKNTITVFNVTSKKETSSRIIGCANKTQSISLSIVNNSEDTFLFGSWDGKLYSAKYSYTSGKVDCNLLYEIIGSSSINGIYQDRQDNTIWFVSWNTVYNNQKVLNGIALPVYQLNQAYQNEKKGIIDIISQEEEIYLLYTTKIRVMDKITMTIDRTFGRFQYAIAFRRDNTGLFAVCDHLGNKVVIINGDDGRIITEILVKSPTGVEWDYDNKLMYIITGDSQITEYVNCYSV